MIRSDGDSFQDTPVGPIASEWEMGVVGDFVAVLQAGVSVNAVETDTGCIGNEIGVLKTSAVLRGKFLPEQHKVVIPEDADRVATSVVGDRIIISRMNTPALVGESGYVDKDAPNLFLPDRLWQTEPSERPHSQRWLSYWLQHPGMRRLIAAGATGTSNSMKNISKETVLSLPIPRTPLPEQQKIAAILTAVDDKLDVIARQIEATQTLKRGLMQILFSRGVGTQDANGEWLSHTEFKRISSQSVPALWNPKRLGDIAPLIRRPVEIDPDAIYPELGLRSYGKGTFHKPALLGSEVGNKRLFQIRAGDLLFSNVFAWEGAVAVARPEDDGRYGSHRYITCVVDATQADTAFLFKYLTTPAGIASLTLASPGGAGRNKTLGLSALANIIAPLPPLAEQRKISQILDDVDTKLRTLDSKQAACGALKRGLMQKLLTGEWWVKLEAETVTA
ncbi:restriction endonuclease subunit S [Oxalobacteraceae bacterium A2-2]